MSTNNAGQQMTYAALNLEMVSNHRKAEFKKGTHQVPTVDGAERSQAKTASLLTLIEQTVIDAEAWLASAPRIITAGSKAVNDAAA